MGKIIWLFCVGFCYSLYSQDVSVGERRMLAKFTASFYKANLINTKTGHSYIGGNLEFFLHDKYSVRGDVYSLIGETNAVGYSTVGTVQMGIGLTRNFTNKRCSPFVGVYAGGSRMILNSLTPTFAPDLTRPRIQFVPMVGLHAGIQYFVSKNFHFFVEARYVHQLNPFSTKLMDEISYTGGLGFQISTKKNK